MDVVARWPGASHDSNIFDNSLIRAKFENGEMQNSVILGDSGYPVRPYLITPLTNPRTEAEQLFNEAQIRTRNVIERTFGIWKRRFPILSVGIRSQLPLAQDIVIATAILHNIACLQNENEFPHEGEVEIEDNQNENIHHINVNDRVRRELIDYFQTLL